MAITGIFGIGREKSCSLCGELGSQFMIDEWEYPAIGVAICDCPSAGHDMIFLEDVYKRQEQIRSQESVLDFTLPAQVREFFLLTAGIQASVGVTIDLSGLFDLTIHGRCV